MPVDQFFRHSNFEEILSEERDDKILEVLLQFRHDVMKEIYQIKKALKESLMGKSECLCQSDPPKSPHFKDGGKKQLMDNQIPYGQNLNEYFDKDDNFSSIVQDSELDDNSEHGENADVKSSNDREEMNLKDNQIFYEQRLMNSLDEGYDLLMVESLKQISGHSLDTLPKVDSHCGTTIVPFVPVCNTEVGAGESQNVAQTKPQLNEDQISFEPETKITETSDGALVSGIVATNNRSTASSSAMPDCFDSCVVKDKFCLTSSSSNDPFPFQAHSTFTYASELNHTLSTDSTTTSTKRKDSIVTSSNVSQKSGTSKRQLKLVTCTICHKKLTTDNLHPHLRTHTSEKPFKCEYCSKQFTHSSSLTKHKRIHTGEKPHKCNYCNKQFTTSSNLIQHRRIHTGEKPFMCEYCNKQFSTSANLTQHRRIHTGEKPFMCEYCNKQFTDSSTLTQHRRIHTGEKPFMCAYCNKQFTTSSSLSAHRRIHTGEKPFKCKYCNKQFTQSSALTRHRKVHTGVKAIPMFPL